MVSIQSHIRKICYIIFNNEMGSLQVERNSILLQGIHMTLIHEINSTTKTNDAHRR